MKKIVTSKYFSLIISLLFISISFYAITIHFFLTDPYVFKSHFYKSTNDLNLTYEPHKNGFKATGYVDIPDNIELYYLFISYSNAVVNLYIDSELRASYTGTSEHNSYEFMSCKNYIIELVTKQDKGKSIELEFYPLSYHINTTINFVGFGRYSDILLLLKPLIVSFSIALLLYTSLILLLLFIILLFRKETALYKLIYFSLLIIGTMMKNLPSNPGSLFIINSSFFWETAHIIGLISTPILFLAVVNDAIANTLIGKKPLHILVIIPTLFALCAPFFSHYKNVLCQTFITLTAFSSLLCLIIIAIFSIISIRGSNKINLVTVGGVVIYVSIYSASVVYNLLFVKFTYLPLLFDLLTLVSLLIIILPGTSSYLKARNSLLKNEILETMSYIDPLSGCYNRFSYEKDLIDYWVRFKKQRFLVSIIDINNMKRINDTLGHNVGDKIIANVSNVLLSFIPLDGKVYRIGGDEFAIIIPNYAISISTYERMLKETYDKNSIYESSISIGSYLADSTLSLSEALSYADQNMYLDKQRSRMEVR